MRALRQPKPSLTSLDGRQVRHLRALAHHLEPIVQVGKEGISDAVVRAALEAIRDHELVKVRLPQVDKAERTAMSAELVRATSALLVAEIGRIVVLYRPHPEKPKIQLPR